MEQKQKEWSKRLKEAIDYLNKTERITNQQELADILGYARANVSRYINGDPTQKFVSKFAVVFSDIFNVEYLLSGEGQLLKKSIPTEPAIPVTDSSDLDIQQHLLQQVTFLQNQMVLKDNELKEKNQEIVRLHEIIDFLKKLVPESLRTVSKKMEGV